MNYEEFLKKYPMTSEERIKLYPELDNDALIKLTESLMDYAWIRRSCRHVPTTYEEDIIYFCLPELIKRLRSKQ